jgi:hypothetical protein
MLGQNSAFEENCVYVFRATEREFPLRTPVRASSSSALTAKRALFHAEKAQKGGN